MLSSSPLAEEGPLRRPGGRIRILAWRRARTALSSLSAHSAEPSYRYLLVLRYCLVNIAALALFGAGWMQGWLDSLIASDGTHLVAAIVATFMAGLVLCTHKIVQTSRELNELRVRTPASGSRVQRFIEGTSTLDSGARANLAASLRLKLGSRIAIVRHVAGSLVLLGLIGTVIGFIIALGGVDPDRAADATAVGPMVSILIEGMSVALHTTLVGAVLNIWLMANYRMLETGTVNLLTGMINRSERADGRV